jgi:MSHA biogenesis protein MshO
MNNSLRGFTLIEAVVVIAVMSVIAAAVAVFIRLPVMGYVDTARRAELADTADTALRRITRDLRLALPNSVRVAGGGTAVEFLLTHTGGRYRSAQTDTGTGDPLDSNNAADNAFDVIGPAILQMAGTDRIAIYNLGFAGANAYAGDTLRNYAGAIGTVSNIVFTPTAVAFPFASPGSRFQVVEGPVSYVCDLASNRLMRYWAYPIVSSQSVPPVGGNSAVLANNVSGCVFTYDANTVAQRNGLLTLQLTLTSTGESVALYHSVHVNNVP